MNVLNLKINLKKWSRDNMFEYVILGVLIGHFSSLIVFDIIDKCRERKIKKIEEIKRWIDY